MKTAGCVAWAALALGWREALVFVRRPSRVIASLALASLVWVFFAGGFADALAPEVGPGYVVSLAFGVALLAATMGAVFAGIGLIRDREAGVLRAVLAGPTPAWACGATKAVACGLLSGVQALPLLFATVVVGEVSAWGLVLAGVALVLSAVGVAGVATALAWWVRSVEGFHSVMNLLLMPMWLLSGAVFPAPPGGVLGAISAINPLAYAHRIGLDALNTASDSAGTPAWQSSVAAAAVVIVFAIGGVSMAGAAAQAVWARR